MGPKENISIQPIDGTLASSSTPGQSGTESNWDERLFHILQTVIQEPYHQTKFNEILRTWKRRVWTSLLKGISTSILIC